MRFSSYYRLRLLRQKLVLIFTQPHIPLQMERESSKLISPPPSFKFWENNVESQQEWKGAVPTEGVIQSSDLWPCVCGVGREGEGGRKGATDRVVMGISRNRARGNKEGFTFGQKEKSYWRMIETVRKGCFSVNYKRRSGRYQRDNLKYWKCTNKN